MQPIERRKPLPEPTPRDTMTEESLLKSQRRPANLKINDCFKVSPTFMHRMKRSRTFLTENCQSKILDTSNPKDQLNKLFLLRKVSNEKLFFNDESPGQSRSKDKINDDIDNSINYIESVKRNRGLMSGKSGVKLPQVTRKVYEDISSAIGLDLQIGTQKQKQPDLLERRFLTEPVEDSRSHSEYKSKGKGKHARSESKNQVGLYSYLERDFISRKDDLSRTKILEYARYPNNKNFHKMILEKSRNFIKEKTKNNYREVGQIVGYLEQQSKQIIEQETELKKKRYREDYKVRRNIPYFSFLTLSPHEKQSVLKSIHRQRSVA